MKRIKPQPVRKFSGWIAPDGKYYPCDSWCHDSTGYILARQYYGEDGSIYSLEQNHWIRLYKDGVAAMINHTMRNRPVSQKQMDTLQDLHNVGGDDEDWKENISILMELSEVI